MQTIGLYVHIPWCEKKCPYCDFNSHEAKGELPETAYVNQLIADLDHELAQFPARQRSELLLTSVFIGGGTPSLFSVAAIANIIHAVKQRFNVDAAVEITMEANPGTLEQEKFSGFIAAGITRLSLGVQSFTNRSLNLLGRIHDEKQALTALQWARHSQLTTYNLDLMHGLPEQQQPDGLADLEQAIMLSPPHISWYQLTIEPHTQFASKPPKLPDDDVLWEIFEQGGSMLAAAGYRHYEISAYALPGQECRHNLNYWNFGDYIGIGCGAHGKITIDGVISRRQKIRHPRGYLAAGTAQELVAEQHSVDDHELEFEYFLNRFRLFSPFTEVQFNAATGRRLSTNAISRLASLCEQQLLHYSQSGYQLSEKGVRYLNNVLMEFLP